VRAGAAGEPPAPETRLSAIGSAIRRDIGVTMRLWGGRFVRPMAQPADREADER
jgi:hypothetical protein